MSRGPGRVERAIRALFDAHPEEAFVVEELCAYVWPGAALERKHRVSVLRATRKLVANDPNWNWHVSESHGGSLAFFNAANVQSRVMARIMARFATAYRSEKRARRVDEAWAMGGFPGTRVMTREQVIAEALKELEAPEKRALREQEVQDHIAIRDGDATTVALVRAKQEARRAAWMAEFASVANVIRNPMAFVARPEAPWSDNTLPELANKARALIIQNDPDAIRAGLLDIANALDSMTQ